MCFGGVVFGCYNGMTSFRIHTFHCSGTFPTFYPLAFVCSWTWYCTKLSLILETVVTVHSLYSQDLPSLETITVWTRICLIKNIAGRSMKIFYFLFSRTVWDKLVWKKFWFNKVNNFSHLTDSVVSWTDFKWSNRGFPKFKLNKQICLIFLSNLAKLTNPTELLRWICVM